MKLSVQHVSQDNPNHGGFRECPQRRLLGLLSTHSAVAKHMATISSSTWIVTKEGHWHELDITVIDGQLNADMALIVANDRWLIAAITSHDTYSLGGDWRHSSLFCFASTLWRNSSQWVGGVRAVFADPIRLRNGPNSAKVGPGLCSIDRIEESNSRPLESLRASAERNRLVCIGLPIASATEAIRASHFETVGA